MWAYYDPDNRKENQPLRSQRGGEYLKWRKIPTNLFFTIVTELCTTFHLSLAQAYMTFFSRIRYKRSPRPPSSKKRKKAEVIESSDSSSGDSSDSSDSSDEDSEGSDNYDSMGNIKPKKKKKKKKTKKKKKKKKKRKQETDEDTSKARKESLQKTKQRERERVKDEKDRKRKKKQDDADLEKELKDRARSLLNKKVISRRAIVLKKLYLYAIVALLKLYEVRTQSSTYKLIQDGDEVVFFAGPYTVRCEVTKVAIVNGLNSLFEKFRWQDLIPTAVSLEDCRAEYTALQCDNTSRLLVWAVKPIAVKFFKEDMVACNTQTQMRALEYTLMCMRSRCQNLLQ
jgi:ASC-1-like (ASCH) protein